MISRNTGALLACLAVALVLPVGSQAPGLGAQAALDTHNEYRSRHIAPALVWDQGLAQAAAAFARQCDFNHDPNNNDQGENLYATSAFDPVREMTSGIKMWYDEVRLYNFDAPNFFEETGHFTQLVWKGTRRMGCAAVMCRQRINSFRPNRGTLVVCRYSPPGNVLNHFRENVEEAVDNRPVVNNLLHNQSSPEHSGSTAVATASAEGNATANAEAVATADTAGVMQNNTA